MRNQRCKNAKGLVAVTMFAFATGSAPTLLAQEKKEPTPDAGRGKIIAERLCTSCHLLSPTMTPTVPVGIPTFDEMANKPNQTASNIRANLITPHAPMPNMSLTRLEIEDIIRFLDQLRKPNSGGRILDDKNFSPKPKYPQPS